MTFMRTLALRSRVWLAATLAVVVVYIGMTATPAARGLGLILSKAFGATSIPVGGSTSLTFTVGNGSTPTKSGISFTDTLPSGLVVATPNGLTNSCGGTVTAIAGSSSISVSGLILDPATSCTIVVNVVGTAAGLQTNTTSTITATGGFTGTAATASITVTAAVPVMGPVPLALGALLLGGTIALLARRRAALRP